MANSTNADHTAHPSFRIIPDEDNKTVTVVTSGGNQVVLDDQSQVIGLKDQHGNSINLSAGGIQIQSNSDLSLKGRNILVRADTQLSAKGSAAAEFSSSGSTSVKGSIVQIN